MTAETVSTETATPPTRKISVTFERKKDLGNYENVVARAWVEGTIPETATTADEAQALGELFMAAASAVFDQLEIEYEIDADNSTVREIVKPKADTRIVRPGGVTQQVAPGAIRVMNAAETAENGPLPEWLIAECNKIGVTGVWDRRATATGNQPHFQEAVSRGATGHGKVTAQNPNGAKGFWPPK